MRAVKSAYSIFFVLWFVIGAAGFSSAADVAKIGVVSIQKILQNSTVGKSIQVTLKKEGAKKEADLKTRQSEIENIRKRLERESMVMSREMRDEKERDLRIKINDFKTLQKKYTTDLQRLEARLMGQLKTDVQQLMDEMGVNTPELREIVVALQFQCESWVIISSTIFNFDSDNDLIPFLIDFPIHGDTYDRAGICYLKRYQLPVKHSVFFVSDTDIRKMSAVY